MGSRLKWPHRLCVQTGTADACEGHAL